jgi:hypothetical protein
MSKKGFWFFLCGWVILFMTFWFNGIKSLDPDFGWHLRVGQMMISQGIPRIDPFSYTMPTFPWVDHGRLSDVAIAWLYPKIGMPGLAAILALLATGALIIAVPMGLWSMALVPFLLGIGVFVVRFGVRPQVEDWLFAAICLRISTNEGLWKKWKWLVPGVFIIWANFHGGWLMGLLIIGLRVVFKGWETGKFNLKDALVLILSILATAVNPYGFKLWEEIWLTVSDTNLRWGIVEWEPFFMKTEMGYWLLTALLFALFKIYGKIISRWQVFLVLVLLLGSASSLRNVPFYVLAIMPIAAELIKQAYETVKGKQEILFRAKKFYAILLVIAGLMFLIEVGVQTWKLGTGGKMIFPGGAVEYLKKNPPKGRLFTEYGWGGYLIWKLPEEKEFIDGRMPSWRWTAPSGESAWAFKDYQKIVNNGDYEKLFSKYGVETVLWPKAEMVGSTQGSMINISNTWLWKWIVYKTGGKPQKSFTEGITKKGWKKVYEDKDAVIYIVTP